MSGVRFNNEQSSKNCVSMSWVGLNKRPQYGMYVATLLSTAGRYWPRVLAEALHLVKTCIRSSAGAGRWESDWHNLQAGSSPLSDASYA